MDNKEIFRIMEESRKARGDSDIPGMMENAACVIQGTACAFAAAKLHEFHTPEVYGGILIMVFMSAFGYGMLALGIFRRMKLRKKKKKEKEEKEIAGGK